MSAGSPPGIAWMGVVTTVDAVLGSEQLETYPEARRQVAVADRLLLTKTDLASPDAVTELEARLTQLNPAAPRYRVLNGEIDPALILDAGLFNPRDKHPDVEKWLALQRYKPVARPGMLGGKAPPAPAVSGHLDERIRAFSLSFDTPLDWAGLYAALEMLIAFRPKNLLRMKAVVNVAGKPNPVVLHGVQHVLYPPAELADWPDEDHRSRFVFITADLEEDFVRKLLEDFTQAAGALPPSPNY
jgi:G3E family GTPase